MLLRFAATFRVVSTRIIAFPAAFTSRSPEDRYKPQSIRTYWQKLTEINYRGILIDEVYDT